MPLYPDDIADSLKTIYQAVTGVTVVHDVDELRDGMPNPDLPLAEIYPNRWSLAQGSTSSKHTFGSVSSAVQITDPGMVVDIYVVQVRTLGQDMSLLVTIFGALIAQLHTVDYEDAFPAGVNGFTVEVERVALVRNDVPYHGLRCTWSFTIF